MASTNEVTIQKLIWCVSCAIDPTDVKYTFNISLVSSIYKGYPCGVTELGIARKYGSYLRLDRTSPCKEKKKGER